MSATAASECPDCKGKGQKLPWKYSLDPYIKCERCKGSGYIQWVELKGVELKEREK